MPATARPVPAVDATADATSESAPGARRRRGRPVRTAEPLPPLVIDDLDNDDRPQVKERVYQRLVRALSDHELVPGTHLKERDLAESMGVSKTPVREALVRMEKEGLVIISPYRGAVVRTLTRQDLREVYELRELLEGFCARRAAAATVDTDEQLLRANVRATAEALDAGSTERVGELLEEFDRILHRQAEGHRIGDLLAGLEAQLCLFGRMTFRAPGRLESSLEQHTQILRAITMRDGDLAEDACRRHVRSVYAELMEQLPVTSAD